MATEQTNMQLVARMVGAIGEQLGKHAAFAHVLRLEYVDDLVHVLVRDSGMGGPVEQWWVCYASAAPGSDSIRATRMNEFEVAEMQAELAKQAMVAKNRRFGGAR